MELGLFNVFSLLPFAISIQLINSYRLLVVTRNLVPKLEDRGMPSRIKSSLVN
jgi:hypothetical protein